MPMSTVAVGTGTRSRSGGERTTWPVVQAGMVYAFGETACLDFSVRLARSGVG